MSDQPTSDEMKAFIKSDDVARLRVALAAKPGWANDARLGEGYPPLTLAAAWGSSACVQALIDAGAHVEDRDTVSRKWTAVLYAAKAEKLDCLAILAKAGANLDAADGEGQTALMMAAARGDKACLSALAELGADIDARDKHDKNALIHACKDGSYPIVMELIERGADLNHHGQNGDTALLWAVHRDRAACVRALVEAGVDIDAKNDGGLDAMAHAAARSPICVEILAEARRQQGLFDAPWKKSFKLLG